MLLLTKNAFIHHKSKLEVMSLKFQNPCSFVFAGPSSVGKTFMIFRFVDHLHEMCPEIEKVHYFYEMWQPKFQQYLDKVTFHHGPPTTEVLKNCSNSLVILDDLMFMDHTFLAKIYCVLSHHLNFSVITTVQNLFHKNLREMSLNTKLVVLFKSCRDVTQIGTFLRQVFPQNFRSALEAYKDATSTARGYLLVDLRPQSDDSQRLRTNIFPSEVNYIYQ